MSSEMIMYQTDDGLVKIETTFEGDAVWLSIDQMSALFLRDRSVIGKHIRNVFKEGELAKNSMFWFGDGYQRPNEVTKFNEIMGDLSILTTV